MSKILKNISSTRVRVMETRGACLAELEEQVTPDLGVVSLSPTRGVRDYLNKYFF